jgi:hypothetical protein
MPPLRRHLTRPRRQRFTAPHLPAQHLQNPDCILIPFQNNINAMASNNNDPRNPRNRPDGPEDNPFIAFRRFADSQVSSLFNTVLELPKMLDGANHARFKCIMGQADEELCDKLRNLDIQRSDAIRTGAYEHMNGDHQAGANKLAEAQYLEDKIEAVQKRILDDGPSNGLSSNDGAVTQNEMQKQVDLVEKVANRKGQEWGWSWDWGFPRPFDASDNQERQEQHVERHRRHGCRRWRRRQHGEAARQEEAERNDSEHQPNAWAVEPFAPPPQFHQPTHFEEPCNRRRARDPALRGTGMRRRYSPGALESDDQMQEAGVEWRDAYEDLTRAVDGRPLMPEEQLGNASKQDYSMWSRKLWLDRAAYDNKQDTTPEETRVVQNPSPSAHLRKVLAQAEASQEEPSYEYSHDHEDQHDEPPTPKPVQGKWDDSMPPRELDAYERLLGLVPKTGEAAPQTQSSSILSTLTTTERTVAPDGTVTTKVMLKKRFADGREESSETLHTQRGQGSDSQGAFPGAGFPDRERPSKEQPKKSGWFWSN